MSSIKEIILFFILLSVASCTVNKKVCPAYQSAFIFDKNTRENTFHYYNNSPTKNMNIMASIGNDIEIGPKDSLWIYSLGIDGPALPKQKKLKRNPYLLLPKKTNKQIARDMEIIERKPVYESYDSAKMAEMYKLDSISMLDSTYRITVAREKFNVEQDWYMWYFRDLLVLPDVKMMMNKEQSKSRSKGFMQKINSFFKQLFRKKDKQPKDDTEMDSVKRKKKFFLFGKRKKLKEDVEADTLQHLDDEYNYEESYDEESVLTQPESDQKTPGIPQREVEDVNANPAQTQDDAILSEEDDLLQDDNTKKKRRKEKKQKKRDQREE